MSSAVSHAPAPSPLFEGDELLTTNEAAELLRLRPITLAHHRMQASGPPFVRLGRKVFYRRSALAAWVNAQERTSTAPTPPKAKARR